MKYSMNDYTAENDRIYDTYEFGTARDEAMAANREKLYQGLEVGDGVTINMWSDKHAGTIVKRTKCKLWIRRDRAIRTDNEGAFAYDQQYRYEPDPEGIMYVANWSRKRKTFIVYDYSISVGRHEYYDYSF